MGAFARAFGPHAPERTYVAHDFDEQLFDTGEVQLNYATAGSSDRPAVLLIPGQTESWWGYEQAMHLLAERFEVFAVDLRGQGRSSRTPGRYTLDNIGNDLVRFLDGVVRKPAIVAGLSSGGVVSTWLGAYARPGQVVASYLEDPPLFASEIRPETGHGFFQCIGPLFAHLAKHLGPQWSIGDWQGMVDSVPLELPERLVFLAAMMGFGAEPGQQLKEYDPEWAQAFMTGTFYTGCEHARMLSSVKVPVLFTHHFRMIDEPTGALMGAISDAQVARVKALIEAAGQPFHLQSFPAMGHSMHGQDPQTYVATFSAWADTILP